MYFGRCLPTPTLTLMLNFGLRSCLAFFVESRMTHTLIPLVNRVCNAQAHRNRTNITRQSRSAFNSEPLNGRTLLLRNDQRAIADLFQNSGSSRAKEMAGALVGYLCASRSPAQVLGLGRAPRFNYYFTRSNFLPCESTLITSVSSDLLPLSLHRAKAQVRIFTVTHILDLN